MLDVKLLAVFREVALRGSFTAAANVLVYTPSAISRQMAVLDRLAEAEERMSALATGVRGRLRLGSFPATTGAFVGLAIRRFRERHAEFECTSRHGFQSTGNLPTPAAWPPHLSRKHHFLSVRLLAHGDRESNGPQSAPVYRSRVPTQQSTREENVTTTITPTTTREGVSRLRERGRP